MALQDPREFDHYTDQLAAKYDQQARKDTALSMRVSSHELEVIKQAAKKNGFDQYQKWVRHVLTQAISDTFPDKATYADDL